METTFEKRRSIYGKYTLCFLITGLCVFGWFIAYDKSMVWDFDGVYQHFNALAYYGKYLRGIFLGIIKEHRLTIPMWDMSIGYGADILTTLNYYAIGDPLTLLCALVPASLTECIYAGLIILRFYLAGMVFILYCRYHKNQGTGVLIGALTYCFSGFAMFCGVRHPYFLNPMIYFPLILIGIDKIFKKEKPWLYVGVTAVSALSNFYFFYMIVIMMVIYAGFRYVMIYGKIRIRELMPWILKFVAWSLLGVGLAMPLLLPSVMYVLGTGRMSAQNYVPVLYPLTHYAKLLNDFFGTDYAMASSRYYTVTGFAPILLVTLLVLFVQKKKHLHLKLGWLLLTILLLIPYAGHVINGFSYVSNRWIWAYGMLLAYILVKEYPDLLMLKKKEKIKLVLLGCVLLPGISFCLKDSSTLHGWLGFAMTALLIGIILMCSIWQSKRILAVLVTTATMCAVAGNAYFLFSPEQTNYIGDFRARWASYAFLTTKAQNQIVKDLEDTETFYRYDQYGTKARENTAMQNRLYGTDFYFSVTNDAVVDFFRDMYLSNPIEQMFDDLDGRTVLDRLAGVKYFIVKKDKEQNLPYGYTEKVAENRTYTVYKTETTLPFGYTYDTVISSEEWQKLSVEEKQQALLQGVYLPEQDSLQTQPAQTELIFTDEEPDYQLTLEGKIKAEGNQYTVKKGGASITFHYEGKENCETYLVIEGIGYDGKATKFGLTVSRDQVEKKKNVYTYRNSFYSGKEDFLYNLGYHEQASSEVTLTFRTAGTYTINRMYLVEQPVDNWDQQTELLKENVMEEVEFGDNSVKGTIHLDQNKVLVLSMAYSKGWTAYVDGEKQPVLQANGMYCALEMEKGDHVIELYYQTPYLMAGIGISLICLLLLFLSAKTFYPVQKRI